MGCSGAWGSGNGRYLAVGRGPSPVNLGEKISRKVVTGIRIEIPLSSHHFRLSELAGGSPGSTLSYPIKSSSSLSSSPRCPPALVSPTTSLLFLYSSCLSASFFFSSTLLMRH